MGRAETKNMGEAAIYVTLYFYAYDLININDDNFFTTTVLVGSKNN